MRLKDNTDKLLGVQLFLVPVHQLVNTKLVHKNWRNYILARGAKGLLLGPLLLLFIAAKTCVGRNTSGREYEEGEHWLGDLLAEYYA